MPSASRPELFLFQRPEWVLAGSFAVMIAVGTVLLGLPVSANGPPLRTLDALFTATSAVCVTGLVVVDTGARFTHFGQSVILLLIQLGGLGIVTFAALAYQVLGLRLSFRSQAVLGDTLFQRDAAMRIRRDLLRVVALTFVIEAGGAILLWVEFRGRSGEHDPLYSAVFHSVSAFCNAGFSLHADSLQSFGTRPLLLGVMMALIICGGLGHSVVLESARRAVRRLSRRLQEPVMWSLHARVVLVVSATLIVSGAFLLALLGLTPGSRGAPARALHSLFQSISARTAGFNSIDIGALPLASQMVLIVLMFVGGSPGSCAGGIKTTSLASLGAQIRSRLRGESDVTLFGRRLPSDSVTRATMIIGLAVLWNGLGCLLLVISEMPRAGLHLEHVIFEQVSAFGTVGLSTGLTPALTGFGKAWIALTMFVGRIGPLTAAMVMMPAERGGVRYPQEQLMVG